MKAHHMTQISGKTAFITGAAAGLGLAMARSFAKQGANIMLADIDRDGLEAAQAMLRSEGANVASVVCDVADFASVEAAAKATIAAFGKVHILVNNAGVALGGKPGETDLRDWRWIIDINLMGVVHGVNAFLPLISAQGEGGHIVNTASMAGHIGGPGLGAYAATKFAVVGYSESLNWDLSKQGIGVSILCPAWVKTGIHKSGLSKPSGQSTHEVAMADPRYQAMTAVVEGGFDAEPVADYVAECIEADRFYIFTHPEMRSDIEKRNARLLADYAHCMDDPRFN